MEMRMVATDSYHRTEKRWSGELQGTVYVTWLFYTVHKYVAGSKSSRPDLQKLRQMENAVRDI